MPELSCLALSCFRLHILFFFEIVPSFCYWPRTKLKLIWCISQIIFKDNSINNKIQKKIYRSADWASKQPRWQVWLPSAVYPGLWAFDQTKSRSFIIIFFLLPNLTTAILRGLPGMSRSASTTRSFSRRGPRRTGTSPWAILWRWGNILFSWSSYKSFFLFRRTSAFLQR